MLSVCITRVFSVVFQRPGGSGAKTMWRCSYSCFRWDAQAMKKEEAKSSSGGITKIRSQFQWLEGSLKNCRKGRENEDDIIHILNKLRSFPATNILDTHPQIIPIKLTPGKSPQGNQHPVNSPPGQLTYSWNSPSGNSCPNNIYCW